MPVLDRVSVSSRGNLEAISDEQFNSGFYECIPRKEILTGYFSLQWSTDTWHARTYITYSRAKYFAQRAQQDEEGGLGSAASRTTRYRRGGPRWVL